MPQQKLHQSGMFPDMVKRNMPTLASGEQRSCESTPIPHGDIHNNVPLTETGEDNSRGCNQNKGENGNKEKIEEYKQLMKMKQDNKRNITQTESELLDQAREIGDVYAMFKRNQNRCIAATGKHAEIRRLHGNYETEADRLRIEHVSQILSLNILSAETKELQTNLTGVFKALAEMREYNKLGCEHVKTGTVAIKKAYEEVKLTNQTVEKNITYLKDELNKGKTELIRLMGITDCSKEVVNNGQTGCNGDSVKKENAIGPEYQNKLAHEYPNILNKELGKELDDKTKHILEGDLKLDAKYDIRWISQTNTEKELKQRNTKDEINYNNSGIRTKIDRTTTSDIPKPVVHPYGSSVRDGTRFRYSSQDKRVLVRRNYNRLGFVPEGQKHVMMHIIHHLDFGKELIRLKREYFEKYRVEYKQVTSGETNRSSIDHETDRNAMQCAKSKTHTNADIICSRKIRGSKPGNKAKTGTAKTVKKNIMSKIDTGVRRSKQTKKEYSPLPPLQLT